MLRPLSEPEQVLVQKVILPVVAVGLDGTFRPVGSCWVFAFTGRDALAFSAAHIFDEVVRSEGRHDRTVVSMPDVLRSLKPKPVSLASTRLMALYRHNLDQGSFLDIHIIYRDGLTDTAICHLSFGSDDHPSYQFEQKMAIHTGPIPFGTDVAAVGYAQMEKTRVWVDESKGLFGGELFHQLAFEHGKCTEYFPQNGPRGAVGPCFEINVLSQHGMSGGPILHKGYGNEIVGCGVISRGTTWGGDDSTVAAALWPAYSFVLDRVRGPDDRPMTLVDLVRKGWVTDHSNGPNHYRMIKELDEDGGIIDWQC